MSAESSNDPVVIVGAGLAGLTAARELVAAGRSVHVVDKGRGVGGRLATRRIGDARLDHGAQFFTVRGNDFRATIDAAIDQGIVAVWCRGFDSHDGYPRYYCPDGMTALAKWLANGVRSSGGTISLGERLASISTTSDSWQLLFDSGESLKTTDLIVTSPVPQTLDLIDAGSVELDADVRATLEAITYKPTVAVLVTLDSAPSIPSPGGIQQSEADTFTFIADNQQKGISSAPAVTFHANGSISAQRWDDDPHVVLTDLLAEAQPWLGAATVIEAQLKKWKFAGPHQPHADRYIVAARAPGTLVLAGDAFGGPKVEGAFNSGLAAARTLLV